MSRLVLYGDIEKAKELLPELKRTGYAPICFCDMKESRRNTTFLDLPVLSISEVKRQFSDFNVYVTLEESGVYEEISRLLDEGIFLEKQIQNEIKEKYISCDHLEYGLVAFSDGIYNCCGDQDTTDYADIPIIPYDINWYEDIDTFISRFIEKKKQLINDINHGKPTFCTGCRYLREDYWSKTKKIRHLNFSLDDSCNLKCAYCYKKDNGFKYNNVIDTNKLITKLKNCKLVSVETQVVYACGEISIQPNANKILSNLQEYEVCFLTNATRYLAPLHDIIKKHSSCILVSLDCGTRETYKKIKGVDLFDTVCENIKKYASDGGNVILKYIIMDDNSGRAEIDGFINLCRECNVRNIRIARDWFKKEIKDNIKSAAMQLAYKAKRNNIFYYNDGTTICKY